MITRFVVALLTLGAVCAAIGWSLAAVVLPLLFLAHRTSWPAWICFLPAGSIGALLFVTWAIHRLLTKAPEIDEVATFNPFRPAPTARKDDAWPDYNPRASRTRSWWQAQAAKLERERQQHAAASHNGRKGARR